MICWFDFFKHIHNHPFGINQESGSLHPEILTPVHFLQFPHVIQFAHLMVNIGQQAERQRVLLLEFCVRVRVVRADAQNGNARFFIRAVIIPEVARLLGTAGSIIFGIKYNTRGLPRNCPRVKVFPSAFLRLKSGAGSLIRKMFIMKSFFIAV